MKKTLLTLSFILFTFPSYAGTISIPSFVSNNDVTVAALESQRQTLQNTINGGISGGTNIQAGSLVSQDFSNSVSIVTFRDEAFNDFTYSGMLPATDTDLTSDISAGVSYVDGVRISKTAESHTYTASKDTYVYINSGGYYDYVEVANGASAPATPSNDLLLAKAVTSGTQITSVTDLRTTSIQITVNGSNFPANYRNQSIVSRDSTTAVHIEPGVVAVGTTLYSNTADTSSRSTATSSNWIEGSVPNLNNLRFYVYAYNNSGTAYDFKYSSADPVYSDSSANTGGTLQYYTNGGTTYRAMAWISADESGNIQSWNYSNFPGYGIKNEVYRNTTAVATGTAHPPLDDTPPLAAEADEYLVVPFYATNANSYVDINIDVGCFAESTAGGTNTTCLFKDAGASATATSLQAVNASGLCGHNNLHYREAVAAPGLHVWRLRSGMDANTMTLNGVAGGRYNGGVLNTSITVKEVSE